MTQPTQIICFSCASFFHDGSNQQVTTCSECNFTIERELYSQLISYASDVVEYGYHYRKAYEEDYRQGKLNPRYQIEFHEIWIFAALAVLSGVIGNAAYDLVKVAIRKMLSRRAETSNIITFEIAAHTLEDEEEFKVFIQYIQDFHNRKLGGLPYEVASAIVEEMFVDEFAKLLHEKADETPQSISEDDFKDMQRKAVTALAAKKRPVKKDFEGAWKKLNESEGEDKAKGQDVSKSHSSELKLSGSLKKRRKKRKKK